MDAFFSFLKVAVIGLFALMALFLILFALPKSPLRSLVLEVLGWTGAGLSTAALVSPLDLIPDVIPIVGWGDDVAYILAAVGCALLGYSQRRRRHLDAVRGDSFASGRHGR
jgi:hypothetical protein